MREIARGAHLPQERHRRIAGDRRLGVALCASIIAHTWLFAVHPGGTSARPGAVPPWSTLSARIAISPPARAERLPPDSIISPRTLATAEGAADYFPAARTPPVVAGAPVVTARPGPVRNVEEETTKSVASGLPPAVDATWYTAQDIDAYPRAAAPLRLALPEGAGAAARRLLLWLRIDEHGEVVEVSAGEPGIPAGWVDAARASLAAIRFAPARKDERPVRSRLLLSVSFAAPGTRD